MWINDGGTRVHLTSAQHRPEPPEPFRPSYASSPQRQISNERIDLLKQKLHAGEQGIHSHAPGSSNWTHAANDYFGSINELREEQTALENEQTQVSNTRRNTPMEDRETHRALGEQGQWLQAQHKKVSDFLQQVDTKAADQAKAARDPDLIHPGDKVVTEFKPADIHLVTDTEVRIALRTYADQAGQLAKATDATAVSDPLRQQAKEDPITYATARLLQEHAGDEAWATGVARNQARVRQEFTRTELNAACARGDTRGAVGLLKTQLDHTANTSERKELYRYVKDLMDPGRFSVLIDKLPDNSDKRVSDLMPNFRGETVGNWLQEISAEGLPPEVANTLLDVVQQKVIQPWDDKQGGVGPNFYSGLSRLVQATDVPSNSVNGNYSPQAPRIADWINARFDQQFSPSTSSLNISQAVANGDSKLSLQLVKTLSGDDNQTWREAVLCDINNGVKQAYKNWQGAYEASQHASGDLNYVARNYVNPGDLETLNRVVLDYRIRFPAKAEGLDAANLALDKQSARLANVSEDVTLLSNEFDLKNSVWGKNITKELNTIGSDKTALAGMQDSHTLARDLFWKSNGDDLSALDAWTNVGLSPYAKGVRGMKNLTDFFMQQHYKVTMDQMLTDYGVDPKLDAKFADRLDKISGQAMKMARNAGVDEARVSQLEKIMRETSDKIRALTSTSSRQAEGDIVKQLEKNMKALVGNDVYLSELKKWNPTDNRVALGKSLRVVAFAAFSVSLGETMNKMGADPSVGTQLTAGSYAGSLAITGVELGAGLRGINPVKDWQLWARYVDRAAPIVSAVPDAVNIVNDWNKEDYVGFALDSGVVAANLAAFAAKLPIMAEFGAAFGPYAPAVIGVVSIARAAWYVGYERMAEANKFEYNDNEVVKQLVKDIGHSDDQVRQLLNQTGDGVSPTTAWSQWASNRGVSQANMHDYLRRLQPNEISELVSQTHNLLDKHLDVDTGSLPKTDPRYELVGKVTYENSTEVVNISPELIPQLNAESGTELYHVNQVESLDGLNQWMINNGLDYESVIKRPVLAQSNLPNFAQHPAQAVAHDNASVTLHQVKQDENLWNISGGDQHSLNELYGLNTGLFDHNKQDGKFS